MQPDGTPELLPLATGHWLQTGNHVFVVDGVKSGEAEKDKIWALLRLIKDWPSYYQTIYTDSSATNDAAIGGGGIFVTVDHPSNSTIHISYAIPAHAARAFKPK